MIDTNLPSPITPQGELTPIFPINNFICFPKTIFPLHIFEPRYRRMLADIQSLAYNKFVITSFIPNSNSLGIEPKKDIQLYRIGVLCQVLQTKTLTDGRSNIIVEGIERVEIIDYFRPYTAEDYAIGEIKPFGEEKFLFDDKEWEILGKKLYTLFGKNFEKFTGRILNIDEKTQALEREEVINTICQLLQTNIQTKFQLLEQNNIQNRAHLLIDILQKNDNNQNM